VQKDTSEIETKPHSGSWVKFAIAMLIIAIIEFCYLSLPNLIYESDSFYSIRIIYGIAFVPNMILGPLACLWFGILFSPASKRATAISIGTVLSAIVLYLYIKSDIAHNLMYSNSNNLIMGIFHVGIIWILVLACLHGFTLLKKPSEAGIKSWIIIIGSPISILILLILIIFSSGLMEVRRAALMSRAKGTLRSVGSTQLAYQGSNNYKDFGSFQALKNTGYIPEGYTLGNMIENYSMTWAVCNIYSNCLGHEDGFHAFTVVAYPRDSRPGYLMTFGVTEAQVVRMYNPDNLGEGLNEFNSMWDPRVPTWDPVL
jgi:hypothetical protein